MKRYTLIILCILYLNSLYCLSFSMAYEYITMVLAFQVGMDSLEGEGEEGEEY